jgi:predicted nucleic acid-binding protein
MTSVLVDTCVWSAVLRRSLVGEENPVVNALKKLVEDGNVAIIGSIRQEILSGISDPLRFEQLRTYLSAFPDLVLKTADFEKAAFFNNECRRNGIQGSHTDFLICAVSFRTGFPIFTTDNDFKNFKAVLPIQLFR